MSLGIGKVITKVRCMTLQLERSDINLGMDHELNPCDQKDSRNRAVMNILENVFRQGFGAGFSQSTVRFVTETEN